MLFPPVDHFRLHFTWKREQVTVFEDMKIILIYGALVSGKDILLRPYSKWFAIHQLSLVKDVLQRGLVLILALDILNM